MFRKEVTSGTYALYTPGVPFKTTLLEISVKKSTLLKKGTLLNKKEGIFGINFAIFGIFGYKFKFLYQLYKRFVKKRHILNKICDFG